MIIKIRKACGYIAEIFHIKKYLIKTYERIYDLKLTIEMYILKPFDKKWEQKNALQVMSIDETLDYLIKNKCSIARFGDGEFNIVSGNGIGFQNNDEQLIVGLKELLRFSRKFSSNDHCLIALPGIFRNEEDYDDSVRRFWNKILVHKRKMWYGLCDKSFKYGNADITRCYIELQNKSESLSYFEKMKILWKDREVIIIEGDKSRLGVGNDLFDNCKSIKRILCPHKNAFNVYDKVMQYVEKNVDNNCLVLIALGPTATLMAAELSQKNYQVIDIGNVDKEYEWCLANSTQKFVNPIKFTMEVPGGADVAECNDSDYLKSIIKYIY